jgi:hypothetical protein
MSLPHFLVSSLSWLISNCNVEKVSDLVRQ